MIRTLLDRSWPGFAALLLLASLAPAPARADGPIPISTNSVFYYRFDMKIGPSAFARPAGPWYSYFPVDPNLLAQPRAAAFPNWPTQFPAAPAPLPPPTPRGMGYYPVPAPYSYGAAGVYPAGYAAPPAFPGYWYGN